MLTIFYVIDRFFFIIFFIVISKNAIEEKVLERAAQKLRLDQLVIQQGRVSQQQKGNYIMKI